MLKRLTAALLAPLCLLVCGAANAACIVGAPPPFSTATSLATMTSNLVTITGGCIDATPIGDNTPSTGHFTNLTLDSLTSGSGTFGALTVTGILTGNSINGAVGDFTSLKINGVDIFSVFGVGDVVGPVGDFLTLKINGVDVKNIFAPKPASSNAALKAIATATAPTVLRTAYGALGDNAPLLFAAQAGTCAANGYVDDGGLCVDTTAGDGNSWLALPDGRQLEIRQFGCVGNSTADDTACVTNFLNAAMKLQSVGHVTVGTYRVTAQLPTIIKQIHLFGDGKLTATILGAYNRIGTNGVLNFLNGSDGSSLEMMSIQTAAGTTGGCVLRVVDDGTPSPSSEGSNFKHLWLTTTGSDTHVNTVCLDGSGRVAAPPGLRETMFEDVDVFGSNGCSFYAKSVVGLAFIGGSINTAGGTNTLAGSACIDGTAAVPSQYVTLAPNSLNGYLSLANTIGGTFTGPSIGSVAGISITDDSTVSNWTVRSFTTGTVQTAWLNSSYTGSDGVRRKTFTNGEFYVHPGGVVEYWQRVTATLAAQTLTFDAGVGGFRAVPRCVAQMLDMPAASRETADLASVTTTTVDYSTSSAVSRAMDIRCIGVAANGSVLPGYP